MAINQPISTDPLNSPDHSLSHRVIANDSAAPDKAVVVNADGNVGIGTTSPLTKLSIQGTAGTDLMNVALPTTGASALYVAEDGNVGIGETSPTSKLDIVQTDDTSGLSVYSNVAASVNEHLVYITAANSAFDKSPLYIKSYAENNASVFTILSNVSHTGNYIGGSGNGCTMHLGDPDTSYRGSYSFERNLGTASTSAVVVNIQNSNATDDQHSLRVYDNALAAAIFTDKNNSGYGIDIDGDCNSASNLIGLRVNVANAGAGAAYAAVFETGNVGIGTANPSDIFHIDSANAARATIAGASCGSGDQRKTMWNFRIDGSNLWQLGLDNENNNEFFIRYHDNDANKYFVIETDGNIGIGTTSPNRILGIGGLVTRNIGMERGTVANTAGFDLTLNAGGATSAATDKAGGDLILQSGIATGDGGSEMELQIAEASQGTGTADRSPTTVVKIDNTKSTLIGDGGTTNYAKFASDGELGLHGTARIKRHTRVGAGSWCGGTSAPTQGCEGAFMYLEFDNSTDDEAYYVLPIPARWDNTTDIEFSIDWYYTGTQDNGTVCWALEYKSIKDGEAITGGTTTIAQTSTGTHTTGQMVRTTFTTKLLAANLERGDTIGLRVFRDVDGGNDSGDTLATNARGINTHFRFIMNRLGDAT